MTINPKDLGTLAICALRYCIGRRTYMPSDVIEVVCTHWDEIDDYSKVVIKRDLEEAIASRDLGDDCDIATWKQFKRWLDDGKLPQHPEATKWGIGLAAEINSESKPRKSLEEWRRIFGTDKPAQT